jgi:CheY-like chemotaxis protein
MLEDLGHEVLEAASGLEALKILANNSGIELVITDQNMPGMTGLQLVQQVRTKWPNIDVVLATGYAELPPEEGRQFPRDGMRRGFFVSGLLRLRGGYLRGQGSWICSHRRVGCKAASHSQRLFVKPHRRNLEFKYIAGRSEDTKGNKCQGDPRVRKPTSTWELESERARIFLKARHF